MLIMRLVSARELDVLRKAKPRRSSNHDQPAETNPFIEPGIEHPLLDLTVVQRGGQERTQSMLATGVWFTVPNEMEEPRPVNGQRFVAQTDRSKARLL
jgi:hypothetical protein